MFKPIRYAMAIDTTKCVGCGACVLACKQENNVPHGCQRDWIEQEVRGEYPVLTMENRSQRCQHCDSHPCVHCCPTGASHDVEGGIVLVNESDCTGCKACIAACPYDARYVRPNIGTVDKCTFCHHRVTEGKLPACVGICPTSCLVFGDVNDPNSEISGLLRKRKYTVQKEFLGLKPQLYWLI